MVLGFGGPTKGMTRIWGHFVILDVCECVILRPQIMLNTYIYLTPYTKGLFIFENKKKVSCHATKLVVTIQIHFVHREEEGGLIAHMSCFGDKWALCVRA